MSVFQNRSDVFLGDQVYEALRRAIAKGELRRGQRVTERGIAALLGVSVTPVREALQRLINEGQVEQLGTRTLQITDPDVVALAEIDEIDVSLQVLAARFAARKATADHIGRMRDELAAADTAATTVEDELARARRPPMNERTVLHETVLRFRALVGEAADNALLERLTRNVQAFTTEEREHAAGNTSVDATTVARYRDQFELLDAIIRHDEDRAADIAQRHARSSLRSVPHRIPPTTTTTPSSS